MFNDHVSAEPLEIIRKNEAEGDRDLNSLTTTRFRRVFNEIEDLGVKHGQAMDELLNANASSTALGAALVAVKDELIRMLQVNEERTGIRYKDGVENVPVVKQAIAALEHENVRRTKAANDPGSPSNFTFNMQLIRDAHGNVGMQFNRATAQFMLPAQEATRLGIGILQACGHQLNIPGPGPGGAGKKTTGGIILPH